MVNPIPVAQERECVIDVFKIGRFSIAFELVCFQGETKWFSKKAFKLPGYFLSHLPGGNLTESQEPSKNSSVVFISKFLCSLLIS